MDRGLLLSLMALEKEFVTRHQFVTAFQAWVTNRFLKLEEILIQRGFLTKSQLMRMSMNLQATLESSNGAWQLVIQDNSVVSTVLADMLTLSEKNSTIHQWVKSIGETMPAATLENSDTDKNLRVDPKAKSEPQATLNLDSTLDPYATITHQLDEDSH